MLEHTRTKGLELFNKRLAFADRYMVYNRRFPEQQRRIHAIADVHTHLMPYFFVSPRVGFWAPQGACGKSSFLHISYFHCFEPILEVGSGAGLLREIDARRRQFRDEGWDGYPSLLLDEAHKILLSDNSQIPLYLSQYTKGPTRTIWDDGKALTMEMFGPVYLSGLTNKGTIDPNFLERNIQLQLEKPLPSELKAKEMLSFALLKQELEDGDGACQLRDDWTCWADDVLKTDMKTVQAEMISLIRPKVDHNGRRLELALPLVQTAYYIGDGLHEVLLNDLICLWNSEDIAYDLNQKILVDIVGEVLIDQITLDTEGHFISSRSLCELLKDITDSPWCNYKGYGLTEESLAFLLKPYGIKPDRNNRRNRIRGYYASQFIGPAKRAVNIDMPKWMEAFYNIDGSKKPIVVLDENDRIEDKMDGTAGTPYMTTDSVSASTRAF